MAQTPTREKSSRAAHQDVAARKMVVCGAGLVGWQIAQQLAGEGHDVTIVDKNSDLVNSAAELLDVRGVVGHASHPDVLEDAGARKAEMIIAATRSDEVNMVTCQVAHSILGVRRKVARLRTQAYLNAVEQGLYRDDHLPIDVVISPEREVAQAALRRLQAPAAFETEIFLNGHAHLLGLRLDEACPILNTPLKDLNELFSTLRAIVVGIRRKDHLFVPSVGDQLFSRDECYVIAHQDDLERTQEVFGKQSSAHTRVVVVGGGSVGLAIATALEKQPERVRVRVIERDRVAAEAAADALDRTIVLNGNGLDKLLLEEASVGIADAILAVTDDDKTNMLVAVRAKAMGCKMAIVLMNDPTMAEMTASLDIDAYINPRATTVSSILRHIRTGRLHAHYTIGTGEAEIFEIEAQAGSRNHGKRIQECGFPKSARVGAILKGGEVVKPVGSTRVEAGDRLVIFSMADEVQAVQGLFNAASQG